MSEYSGTDNLEIMEEAVKYNRFLENLILQYAPPASQTLDFGAGIGTFAKKIRAHDVEVNCLEVDTAQAEILRGAGLTTFTDSTQISDSSFNYVYSLNVLEHIADDSQAMKDIYRILRPGGTALLYVPAMPSLFSAMDRKVGHCRRYTRESLEGLALACGFRVEESTYADSLGTVATWLYKLGNNTSGDINKTLVIAYDRLIFPLSRILDKLCGPWFGKNAYIVLSKTDGADP